MSRPTVSERMLKIVLNAAKKYKEFTAKDLRYDIVTTESTINAALRKLIELGEVEVVYNGTPRRYRVRNQGSCNVS